MVVLKLVLIVRIDKINLFPHNLPMGTLKHAGGVHLFVLGGQNYLLFVSVSLGRSHQRLDPFDSDDVVFNFVSLFAFLIGRQSG